MWVVTLDKISAAMTVEKMGKGLVVKMVDLWVARKVVNLVDLKDLTMVDWMVGQTDEQLVVH